MNRNVSHSGSLATSDEATNDDNLEAPGWLDENSNDDTPLPSDFSTSSSDLSDSARREFCVDNNRGQSERSGGHSLGDRAEENDKLISHLQRLSNAVRAASGEARAAKVNAWWSQMKSLDMSTTQQAQKNQVGGATNCVQDVQFFESSAGILLQTRFPSSPPWLRARVLQSMVYRRVRCLYLMAKQSAPRVRLTAQETSPREIVAQEPVARLRQPDRRTAIKFEVPETKESDYLAATRPSSNVSKVNKTAFRKPPTTIISTRTALSSANDKMLSIPPCPANPSSNDDFTCPYCNFILPSSEAVPGKWKYVYRQISKFWQAAKVYQRRHVIQDLEPYVCIRETCPCAEMLYSTSEDWLGHLRSIHDSRWVCSDYEHDEEYFQDEVAYREHVTERHGIGVDDKALSLLSLLSRANQTEAPEAFDQCPLCAISGDDHSSDKHEAKQFVLADIMAHLRHLATLSLVADHAESADGLSSTAAATTTGQDIKSAASAHSFQQSERDFDNVDSSLEKSSVNLAFTPPSEEVYDVPPDSDVLFSAEWLQDLGGPPRLCIDDKGSSSDPGTHSLAASNAPMAFPWLRWNNTQNELSRWLGVPDQSSKFLEARHDKLPGTGSWLLSSSQFSDWKASQSSFMWLYGPGKRHD